MLKQENVFLSIFLSPVCITCQAMFDFTWFSRTVASTWAFPSLSWMPWGFSPQPEFSLFWSLLVLGILLTLCLRLPAWEMARLCPHVSAEIPGSISQLVPPTSRLR